MRILKTGIIGWGLAGRYFHAPFIKHVPGLEITAVVTSREVDRALFPGVTEYTTVEEMLRNEGLDLVVVCSPDDLHLEHALLALQAGCHVVVEKPVVTTLEEYQVLKSEVERSSSLVIPFQNRRWDGDFRTVRQVIDSGELGEVYYYAANWPRYRPEGKDRSGNWRGEAGRYAGLMLDLGAHLLDQVVHLFGRPDSVFAQMGANRSHSIGEDWFNLQLFYSDGLRAVLEVDSLNPFDAPRFHIRGTNGAFEKFGLDVQEPDLVSGAMPGQTGKPWGLESPETWGSMIRKGADGNRQKEVIETLPGDYGLFYQEVYAAIVRQAPPPVSLRDIETQLIVFQAAAESNRDQRVVSLP